MADPDRCPNCETELHGVYCSRCGQDNTRRRLDTRAVLASIFEHLTDLDLPIVRTVVGLTRNPGRVSREYVDGRRRRYTNPLKYCFITLTVMVLVMVVFDISASRDLMSNLFGLQQPAAAPAPAPAPPPGEPLTRGDEIRQRIGDPRDLGRTVELSLNYITLFVIPIVALILRGLFAGRGLHFAEHYAFASYTFGHVFLINSITMLLGSNRLPVVFAAQEIIQLAYLAWAILGFYRVSIPGAVLRAIVVDVAYMLGMLVCGVLFVTGIITYRILTVFLQ